MPLVTVDVRSVCSGVGFGKFVSFGIRIVYRPWPSADLEGRQYVPIWSHFDSLEHFPRTRASLPAQPPSTVVAFYERLDGKEGGWAIGNNLRKGFVCRHDLASFHVRIELGSHRRWISPISLTTEFVLYGLDIQIRQVQNTTAVVLWFGPVTISIWRCALRREGVRIASPIQCCE